MRNIFNFITLIVLVLAPSSNYSLAQSTQETNAKPTEIKLYISDYQVNSKIGAGAIIEITNKSTKVFDITCLMVAISAKDDDLSQSSDRDDDPVWFVKIVGSRSLAELFERTGRVDILRVTVKPGETILKKVQIDTMGLGRGENSLKAKLQYGKTVVAESSGSVVIDNR